MGLDFYAGDLHTSIDHQDEYLFELLDQSKESLPTLDAIWRDFYESPSLSAAQAGQVVHELLHLLQINGGLSHQPLARLVMRLCFFFSEAHMKGSGVTSRSD